VWTPLRTCNRWRRRSRPLTWESSSSAMETTSRALCPMMERYVRHVLVEDDGHLVGIVSVRDLLGAYASGEFHDADDEA
jgi:CBS-domain-containing membrane protein